MDSHSSLTPITPEFRPGTKISHNNNNLKLEKILIPLGK